MKSISNKVFDQISSLISQNTHYMNTLRISFPYEYAANVADLNWRDILFAINYGYMHHRAAIKHAQIELERDDYPQAVLDLACVSSDQAIFPHSIHPYIDELVAMVDEEDKGETKYKIMYILLKWVYEHGAGIAPPHFNDILDVAESIYHDFGFPETIISFASWRILPMREPDLGSVEKNKARILDYWKQFLDSESKKWKKDLS